MTPLHGIGYKVTAGSKLAKNPAAFSGFPAGSLKFLSALKKNNNREWFQPRKQEFEDVLHSPLAEFATLVNGMLERSAPEYAYLEPRKALNRIYRDIRFSTNKTPYQDHVSMLFPHQRLGKKTGAALYFALSATEVMIAGGMYFGETRELQAVREHLAVKHPEFRRILSAKPLKEVFGEMSGVSLQKTPRQFGVAHPAADLLKQKQWLLMAKWPAKMALHQDFVAEALSSFRLLLPFISFINAPLKALVSERPTIGAPKS